jgi:hypothetical protein
MTTCADVTDCLLFRHLALFLGGVDTCYQTGSDLARDDALAGSQRFFCIILSLCLVVFFTFSPGPKALLFTVFLWEGSRGGRTRGLSEDTGGVIDQRRKKDSEDLPPAPFFPGLIF